MSLEVQPRIVVFGVGGAGGNAVNNMIEAKLQGVEFIVANTDSQALDRAKTEYRIQLGAETTQGLGAGARPDIGAAAAEESAAEIKEALHGAHMVFVAAGMGGGTGTGAAPVVARLAREAGILTVGVVTKPFGFEGTRRMNVAEGGVEAIRENVDTLIVVPNQNLFRVANERTTFADAFRMADDVLYSGVRGITDLMVMPGLINLDFADVRVIMAGMGSAMMGMGEAKGEERALEAARTAIDNPLLDDVTLKGAKGVLINITGGYDMTLFEVDEAANEVRAQIDPNANIILGSAFDPDMEGTIRVSVVAAGLESQASVGKRPHTEAAIAAIAASVAKPVNDDTPPPAAEEEDDRPTIITHDSESDTREDFPDRDLPAAHIPAAEGTDEVAADAAFGGPASETDPAVADDIKGGFENLFGWRRGASDPEVSEEEDTPPPPQPETTIISSPDDHPEPAPFDDEDLEIPAFLRRSANH